MNKVQKIAFGALLINVPSGKRTKKSIKKVQL
jgi:hypothetical protein